MSSVVAIVNMALGRIGIGRAITSLEQNSPDAISARQFYEPCRDRVLRDYPWPFATKFVALGLLETAGTQPWAGEWGYAYTYPSDCITLRRLVSGSSVIQHGFTLVYGDAGHKILTNVESAKAEYTARITDPERFDSTFVSALAWCLASEMAMPLAVQPQLRSQAMQAYQMELSLARRTAGNEAQPPQPEPESEFIRARQ